MTAGISLIGSKIDSDTSPSSRTSSETASAPRVPRAAPKGKRRDVYAVLTQR